MENTRATCLMNITDLLEELVYYTAKCPQYGGPENPQRLKEIKDEINRRFESIDERLK